MGGFLIAFTPAMAGDASAIKDRIAAFEKAFNAGKVEELAALYTKDALVLAPGSPMIEGREGIAKMWQGILDSGFTDLDLQAREIVVVGGTAYETGTFEGTVVTDDGETKAAGKYIVVWKKQDGRWKLHRDIWNETPTE
jgi:uncharacterized protein (TIGR02246 family)